MTVWTPTAEWLDDIYAREVRPAVFDRSVTTDHPTLVMVGGQPAAGKSRAGEWATAQHDPMAEVTGDDLRYLHPDFRRLKRDDPMAMPNVTQAVSGPLVRRCLDEAVERRYSLLLEGVFRDPAVTVATIERFHAAGFTVHAVAVAVPPQLSRASAINRFLTQGRWTPPSAHDSAVQSLPGTVQQVATHRDVARFTVVDRSGVLRDSTIPGAGRGEEMRAVVQHAHTRSLTDVEARQVATLQRAIVGAATTPGTRLSDLGPDAAGRATRWAEHGTTTPPDPAVTLPAAIAASFPHPPQTRPRSRPARQTRPSRSGRSPGTDLGR